MTAERTLSLPRPIAFQFALSVECKRLIRQLSRVTRWREHDTRFTQGFWDNRPVVVAVSGAGSHAAAAAAKRLCRFQASWHISAGFAGGLTADLSRGSVLLADRIMNVCGNATEGFAATVQSLDILTRHVARETDEHNQNIGNSDDTSDFGTPSTNREVPFEPTDSNEWLREFTTTIRNQGLDPHIGPLVTVNEIVRAPRDKLELAELTRAKAVDMESFAVARVCQSNQTRFLSVRVVSDDVNTELPFALNQLLNSRTTRNRLYATANLAIRQPSLIPQLLRLARVAADCSATLSVVCGHLSRILPRE